MRVASFLGSSRKNREVLLLAAWCGDVWKRVRDGQKRCNITWGYVASFLTVMNPFLHIAAPPVQKQNFAILSTTA